MCAREHVAPTGAAKDRLASFAEAQVHGIRPGLDLASFHHFFGSPRGQLRCPQRIAK